MNPTQFYDFGETIYDVFRIAYIDMSNLSEGCKDHLEKALQSDEPSKKDYHIRQVLQACGVDDLPEGFEPGLETGSKESSK